MKHSNLTLICAGRGGSAPPLDLDSLIDGCNITPSPGVHPGLVIGWRKLIT